MIKSTSLLLSISKDKKTTQEPFFEKCSSKPICPTLPIEMWTVLSKFYFVPYCFPYFRF